MASFAGAVDARRGSSKAAADGGRGGLATGGLAAALHLQAEEKQFSEAGGGASGSGEQREADDASSAASVQLPIPEPLMEAPEAEGDRDAVPCQSAEPASADK